MILTEEERKLASENHGLIYYVLNHMNLKQDDYYGAASIGLCKAVREYRPELGRFSTFAVRCIRNEILLELRHERKFFNSDRGGMLYLEEQGNFQGRCLWMEYLPDRENFEKSLVSSLANEEFIGKLKAKERFVLNKLMEGFTTYEIGKLLNQSHQSVSAIKNKIARLYRSEGYG